MTILTPIIINPESLKEWVANSLNLGIVLGSLGVKLPQILIILREKNVIGLSEDSFLLELASAGLSVSYNYLTGLPFKTWGEMFFIAVQCVVQTVLYWNYCTNARTTFRTIVSGLFLVASGILFYDTLPSYLYGPLAYSPIVIGIASKWPQISQNWNQKHTGNLSSLTCLLNVGGNLARIFTTLQHVNDSVILVSHIIAGTVNGVLLLQVVIYRQATLDATVKSKKAD